MKRKLLLAALCVVSALGLRAQTDVTSTYITNADFEGDVSSYTQPQGDRDIYQPAGWSISYTNGESNDMTSLNDETTQWSNFSGKPQPGNGGSKAYWMRFRWGSSENITLSQETSTSLPAGTYAISVDAYSDDKTGTVTISAAGVSQTVVTDGVWRKNTVVFTLASAQKVTVSLSYTNTAADNQVAAFDNVKILDLSSEPTGITLRNELGGTAANLSDFNVWYNDYTLEVEGTADTEITVAADNISYTPKATGTVRFVKKDGIVYVFEGTSYKTAVHSSKADYTYSRTLSKDDPITGNYLENPSFETLGDKIADGKYKFGTPWTTNVTEASGGIRVMTSGSAQHGSYVLVWRGSGNNNYFSQSISSLPQYKGYKVFLQQIAGSNANANFNIGLGNAAGDYSYLSTQMKLGASNDGTKNAELGINENMPSTGVYFTFRNTSSNTASSGSDPVSQIDWIGLVGSDDFPISGVSSASYVYGTAYAPATAKASYLVAKATAEETINNDDYENVAGSEKAALQAAIDAVVADNDAAYNTATSNLQTVTAAFIAAKDSYDAYATALAEVGPVTESDILATPIAENAFATADDALTAAAVLTKYNDVKSAASASPVESSFVTNGTFDSNKDGWSATGGFQNNQTKASDGNVAFDKFWENWNGSAKVNKMYQTIENIPNGTYCLNISAFVNNLDAESQYVFANSDKTYLTTAANSGADYKVFTVVTNNTIEIGLEQTTATANWMVIDNVSLTYYGTGDVISSVKAGSSDYTALNSAISAAEAKTLGFDDDEYAPYNNVDAINKLALAKAVDQTTSNKKSDVQTVTSNLTGATWTANDGDVDAIYNGDMNIEDGNNPKGWTRANNAWGQRVNHQETTAWYYNTSSTSQYGNAGVYTMPLAANTAYELKLKYCSQGTAGGGLVSSLKVSVLNEDEEGLALKELGANNTQVFVEKSVRFFTGKAGNYILSIANTGNFYFTGVSLLKATNLTATYSPTLEGYRTFYNADVNYQASSNAEIYIATALDAEKVTLAKMEAADKVIPAGTPVILKSTNNADITLTPTMEVSSNDFTGNELKVSTTTMEPANVYVLGYKAEGGFGMWYYTGELAAGKVYLDGDAPAALGKLRIVIDGEANDIDEVEIADEGDDDAPAVNVAGQIVGKDYKGIVIKAGKKYLQR